MSLHHQPLPKTCAIISKTHQHGCRLACSIHCSGQHHAHRLPALEHRRGHVRRAPAQRPKAILRARSQPQRARRWVVSPPQPSPIPISGGYAHRLNTPRLLSRGRLSAVLTASPHLQPAQGLHSGAPRRWHHPLHPQALFIRLPQV